MVTETTVPSDIVPPSKFEIKYDEKGDPIYSFPPFPDPPPGVTIIPFKDFKPRGIQVANTLDEDAVEIDGDGRPTVQLNVTHDLNKPPTSKKKKKTNGLGGLGENTGENSIKRPIWYEDWAEGESLRSHFKYDPNTTVDDRMSAAAENFKKSRIWPISKEVREYFDQILIYMGLQGCVLQRFRRIVGVEDALMPEDDWDEDEDDDDPMLPEDQDAARERVEEHNERVRKEMEPSVRLESDEHYQKRKETEKAAKATKLEVFIDNPEISMRVFFSSYFQAKGMIWSELKIRDYPILFLFFLRFIVRNKALPELERDLEKAIAVAEQAKKELPKTLKFAKCVPDELACCCLQVFGRQVSEGWDETSDDEDTTEKIVIHLSKKRKLGPNEEENGADETTFEDAVKHSGSFFIDHNAVVDVPMGEKDEDKDKEVPNAAASEWADAGAAQNWTDANPGGWGDEGNGSVWGAPNQAAGMPWKQEVHNLINLLGPTSLPLTHKVGYVEDSVRRVVSWSAPEPSPSVPDLGIEMKGLGTHDPLKKFARYVLAPYASYSVGDRTVIREPKLLKDPNSTKKKRAREADAPANVPLHDPLKDNIVLLLDASTVEHAFEGMLIGGAFVQLVPDDQPEGDASRAWWYAENVLQVLPSYWTEEAKV